MKRPLLLDDTAIVLYADGAPESLHAAVLQLYARAKAQVAALGADRVDDEGEVHRKRWRFIFGEDVDELSARQRRFLHGPVLGQIAERGRANGQAFPMPVWKEYLREKFLGFRWECVLRPGQKRATPRKVRISTEDLSVKQYSEYIDKVIAFAVAELGVEFDLNPAEREEARYRPKQRKRATEEV